MGTIAENLQAIIDSKTAIKASIGSKGVNCSSRSKIKPYLSC